MAYNGIDVSVYQRSIDWQRVAQSNIDFAMIRASYGLSGIDSQFENNMRNINNTSIARGAYHYCYSITQENAVAEANHFLDVVSAYKFNYPLALDFEYEPLLSLSKTARSNIALAFCDTLEKAGYYAIIYANLNWLVNYLDMNILNRFDIWLAQWGPQPTYTGNFGIWQYTSTGRVPGITGNVDRNISYKDYPTIIRKNGLNGFTPTINLPTGTFNYTVVIGDNLWNIAKRFLGSSTRYTEIMSLNKLTSTILYPGQVLKIPLSAT